MDNKKLVFLKQLSTFVEDRSLWVEPNRKYDFRLSPSPPFTIFVEYRLRFDIVKFEIKLPIDFALTFHYICWYENRMRFGIAQTEIKFPFVSALTFHYICCL